MTCEERIQGATSFGRWSCHDSPEELPIQVESSEMFLLVTTDILPIHIVKHVGITLPVSVSSSLLHILLLR